LATGRGRVGLAVGVAAASEAGLLVSVSAAGASEAAFPLSSFDAGGVVAGGLDAAPPVPMWEEPASALPEAAFPAGAFPAGAPAVEDDASGWGCTAGCDGVPAAGAVLDPDELSVPLEGGTAPEAGCPESAL
jgi:hypothetical protein